MRKLPNNPRPEKIRSSVRGYFLSFVIFVFRCPFLRQTEIRREAHRFGIHPFPGVVV